jgi:nucleoside-diphosphate-sugar epimerase
MKTILVTGANGFIGTALKKHLQHQQYTIYEFNEQDGDIAQKNALDKWNEYKVDHVIHLAGKTFVPQSWHDPYTFYTTNVIGTLTTLEFCKKHKISLTYLSTYLYGIPKQLPISEDAELNPNNPYSYSKYLAEKLCQFYYREFGVKVTIFRPFNVYGHRQNSIFLIPAIIHQILHSDAIRVKELASRRDYVYLEDLVRAIILSLDTPFPFEIYNIGSGESLSVAEVIDIIQKIFKTDKKVISENVQRKNEIAETIANIDKAKQKLGWNPKYTFYNGINEIYKNILNDISSI